MLNCRQITRLLSQSMDGKLRWHQNLAVRLHLLYCLWCRRYAVQLKFLRKATRQLATDPAGTSAQKLSGEAKTQINARLQEELKHLR